MKRAAIDLYKKSALDYLHVLQCNWFNLTPQVLWNSATFGKHPITTSKTPRGYTSEIQFFGEKFIVTDDSELESIQKVSIVAANQLLGLRLPHWEVVTNEKWKKTRTTTEDQLQLFEKARYEAIKVCFNRAREIMISSKTTIQNVTPDEFWEKVTQNKHMIATNLALNGFISTIDFFDETIGVEEGSRMKVAAIALDKLLGIRLPHWSEYVNSNTSNVSIMTQASRASDSQDTMEPLAKRVKSDQSENFVKSSSTETKLLVVKDDNDTNRRKKTSEVTRDYTARLNELLSNYNNNIWTPAHLWHALIQPHVPIVTKSLEDGFISTIEFQDKTFMAKNKIRALSRHSVAATVFDEALGTCLPNWKEYTTNSSMSSSTLSSNW